MKQFLTLFEWLKLHNTREFCRDHHFPSWEKIHLQRVAHIIGSNEREKPIGGYK